MMKNSNDWTVLSPCVAYTTTIIQISVGETGGYHLAVSQPSNYTPLITHTEVNDTKLK